MRAASRKWVNWTLAAVCVLPAVPQPTQSQQSAGAKAGNAAAIREADAAFHRGFAASQAGRLEEARAQFAEAVRLAPQIAEGHDALGSVLIALGRSAEAIPELEKAAKQKPRDSTIEGDLARAYTGAGQAAKAIPHFETALKLTNEPENPEFHDSYARALDAVGRRGGIRAQTAV